MPCSLQHAKPTHRILTIDPGPDLVRHELHRAPGQLWIGPVVTGIEKRAERADLVSEFENPVRDTLRGFRDHQTLEAAPGRELGIRLAGKVAHHVQRAGLCELGSIIFSLSRQPNCGPRVYVDDFKKG